MKEQKNRMIKFKKSWLIARYDTTVLKQWEKGEISSERAKNAICANNKIIEKISNEEFEKIANSLGYFRKK